MLMLRDPADLAKVEVSTVGALLAQRFDEISPDEPYEPDVHGYFVLAEPGDTVAAIEAACGCPIVRSINGEGVFGMPEFQPCFEVLEEHDHCYEIVFIAGDGDFGVVIIVPKCDGIDPVLTSYCQTYASTASS
jgi:hypothetical protein